MRETIRTILALAASILLSGCYTMYTIPSSDYNTLQQKHEKIEITLKDNRKIELEQNEKVFLNDSVKIFYILKETEDININYDNIKEIKEERLDLVKSAFSIVWLSVIGISLILIIGIMAGGSIGVSAH